MEVTLGVSNRHIHLNKDDYNTLFGNEKMKVYKNLVQPNQYASTLFVDIKTEKNTIKHVRVIGPIRKYTQLEISKSDAYYLGIDPPINDSGDLTNAAEVTVVGPNGNITKKIAIIATRHIHLSKKDVEEKQLVGVKEVTVHFCSEKPTTFYNVKLKVEEEGVWELHLDLDDANCALLKTGDVGIIDIK